MKSRFIRTDDLRTVPMRDQYHAWHIVVRGIVVKDRLTGIVGVPG